MEKQVIIDVLKPGAVFGNIGFDPEMEEGHFAELTQQSYVCTLPQNFFLQIMQKRPDVALRALQILNQRMAQYASQLRFLSLLNARDRILAMVHLINEKEDHSILPSILRIPTKITHEKLASMTGLTRETVTRHLQELEDEGLITIEKKHIRLTDLGRENVKNMH